MRTPKYLLFSAFLIAAAGASAQDLIEAYNLSNLTVQGTARSMGFGNALGSVGGDFSSLSVNPAGLGVYRSSELTITPSMRFNNASSQYLNQTTLDNNAHFNINNFGIVLTRAEKGKRYERSDWKTVSFAFGMNRTADFNRSYTYSGINKTSSLTQTFESDANQNPTGALGIPPYNTLGAMGFQTYLIDTLNGNFYSTVPFPGGINQTKTVTEHGGINEYLISFGGNYKEKLMIGGTIGFPSIDYHLTSTYSESIASGNTEPNPYGFSQFHYNQALDITGIGVNFKFGAIYKITNELRVGAAFHSPTYYSITDVYTPELRAIYSNNNVYALNVGNSLLSQYSFDYSFSSPWRGIVSATYIVKGLGFVTADYEYTGYNTMRFQYPEDYKYEETGMNDNIKNVYKGTSNFRVGVEGLLGKIFMARLGFGYYSNASRVADYNTQRIDLSAGFGFHFNSFFGDVGVVHRSYTEKLQPYYVDYTGVLSGAPAAAPTATIDFGSMNVAMTIGVKF